MKGKEEGEKEKEEEKENRGDEEEEVEEEGERRRRRRRRGRHLLSVYDSTGSLLSMATGKLVPDLRNPDGPYPDLAEFVAILVH